MNRTMRGLFLITVSIGAGTGMSAAQIPDSMTEALFESQGRIGVRVQSMTPELREHFEAPPDRGVLVSHIEAGQPAAQAGVLIGDVIVSAGTRPIAEPFDLLRAVNRVPVGETIDLTIVRAKGEITIRVEPAGEPNPWIDPEHWRDTLSEHLEHGSSELREQLEKLQRRLEELEREFEQYREEQEGEGQKT